MYAISDIGGIPAHPLLVHIPVVLIPMCAIAAIALAVRSDWRDRFGIVLLGVSAIATAGAVLASQSGEDFQERTDREVESHQQAGETARNIALLFFLILAVWIVYPWWVRRKAARAEASAAMSPLNPRIVTALAVLTVVSGVAAVVTIVDAGHSGAKAVWSGKDGRYSGESGGSDQGSGSGEGGESGG
jgi:uncharacterized membrane protein